MINQHRNSGGPSSSSRTPLANALRSRSTDVNLRSSELRSTAISKQRKMIDRNNSTQARTVSGSCIPVSREEEKEAGALGAGRVAFPGTEFRRREAVGSTLSVHSGRPLLSVDGPTDLNRRRPNERLVVRIPRMEPPPPLDNANAESTGTGDCIDAWLNIKDRSERWIQQWSQEQKPRLRRFTKERPNNANVFQYNSSSILTRINEKKIPPSWSNTGVNNNITREIRNATADAGQSTTAIGDSDRLSSESNSNFPISANNWTPDDIDDVSSPPPPSLKSFPPIGRTLSRDAGSEADASTRSSVLPFISSEARKVMEELRLENKEAIGDAQDVEEDGRMKADQDGRIQRTIGHDDEPSEQPPDESWRGNISSLVQLTVSFPLAQNAINGAKKDRVSINNFDGKDLREILANKPTVPITFQSTTNKDKTLTEHVSNTNRAVAFSNGRYAPPVEKPQQQRSHSNRENGLFQEQPRHRKLFCAGATAVTATIINPHGEKVKGSNRPGSTGSICNRGSNADDFKTKKRSLANRASEYGNKSGATTTFHYGYRYLDHLSRLFGRLEAVCGTNDEATPSGFGEHEVIVEAVIKCTAWLNAQRTDHARRPVTFTRCQSTPEIQSTLI